MAEKDAGNGEDRGRDLEHYLRWKAELESIGNEIGRLGALTEEQFLKVGRELSDFHGRAERIAQDCSAVVSGLSSDSTADILNGARDLIDRMGCYLNASEKEFDDGVGMLREVLETAPRIEKHLTGFKKMIKNLGILSISIKIESAQLKDGHDFVTIADDVEKLAVLISSRITDILARVRSLNTLAQHTMTAVQTLEGKQQDRATSIVGNARALMSSIDHKNRSSASTAEGISSDAELLAENIGAVVSSIQFHDITRQQIEHVKEALNDGLPESVRPQDTGSAEDVDARNATVGIRALCQLQKQQLGDAGKKFSEAVKTMVEGLQAIAETTADVCHRVQGLAGARDESSSTSLSSIGDDLSLVVGFLDEIKAGIRELSNAIDSLSHTAGDMKAFVDDIEEIGSEIELIAVNARIKAAHTGDEGAPLGVIAEVIQRLSVEARSQKTAISEELRRIVTTVERLGNEVTVDSAEQTSETNTLTAELDGLLGKLRATDEEALRRLSSIQKEGKHLSQDIDEVAGGLTAHREFSSTIENAVARLDAVIVESRELVPEDGHNEGLDSLRGLERNYTMRSERVIHGIHAVSKGMGDSRSGGGAVVTGGKDHFSSNVELF